ncbi:MAG: hypothetical protein V4764_07100 [Burkholderia sp.]
MPAPPRALQATGHCSKPTPPGTSPGHERWRPPLRAVLAKSGHRRQQDFVRAAAALPAFGTA